MTPELMVELANRHGQCEVDQDLEGTMATLSNDPCYEVYPNGYLLTSHEAIRAFYRGIIPLLTTFSGKTTVRSYCFVDLMSAPPTSEGQNELAPIDQGLFPDGVHRNIRGQSLADVEARHVMPDGSVVPLRWAVVLSFDDEAIAGERFFLDGPSAKLYDAILGPGFADVPGVRRLA